MGMPLQPFDSWLAQVQEAHNGLHYDYSQVRANWSSNKMIVLTCETHGEFTQAKSDHKRGNGCGKCAGKGLTLKDKLAKARAVHGDRYDYSGLPKKFTGNWLVTIGCRIHGDFQTIWNMHVCASVGAGCQKCMGKHKRTVADFMRDVRAVHGNTYRYPNLTNVSTSNKIHIVCKYHGSFHQLVEAHLRLKQGCPECGLTKNLYSRKPYKLGRRTVHLQGYEPQALDLLLAQGFKPQQIATTTAEGVPIIPYTFEGKARTYRPDFFIEEQNLVIEVKSDYTWELQRKKNVAKLKAARAHYDVWLLILHDDGSIYLSDRRAQLSGSAVI